MIAEGIEKSAQDIQQNQLQVAMQRLEDLTDTNPYSVDLLLNKSTICYASNDTNEALKILKKAIQVDPFDYRIYYNLFAIYCKDQKYNEAYINFKKCLSLLYTLIAYNKLDTNWQNLLNRSVELWHQNTAAYVLKAINLVNQDKLAQANEVAKSGLQKCIMKHHIYALCCLIESKLNRQAERLQNAKDYHAHLLRPIVHVDHIEHEDTNQEAKSKIGGLRKQFNQTCRKCDVASYRHHQSQPNMVFMSMKKPVSINLEYQISKNSGVFDLACIKQDKQQSDIVEKSSTPLQQPKVMSSEDQQKEQISIDQAEEGKYEIKDLSMNNSKEDNRDEGQKYGFDNSRSLQQANELVLEEVKQAEWGEGSKNLEQNMLKQQKPFQLGHFNELPAWMNDKPKHEQASPTQKKQQPIQPPIQNNSHKKEEKSVLQEELLYPITHAKFEVRLIMADLQINQELVGKMDPYVYYEYGNQKHKTTIAKGQGLKPRWENQIKVFSLERNPTNMRVSVYDREVFRWDDLVGEGNLEVTKIGEHKLPIYLKGKKKGEVVFFIQKVK